MSTTHSAKAKGLITPLKSRAVTKQTVSEKRLKEAVTCLPQRMGLCSPGALRDEGVAIPTELTGQSTSHKAWPTIQRGSRSWGWGVIHLYGKGHKVNKVFILMKVIQKGPSNSNAVLSSNKWIPRMNATHEL